MTTVKSSGASVKSWQYDIVRTVAIDGVPPPARKDCSPNAIPSVILATSTPSSDRSNSPAWMRLSRVSASSIARIFLLILLISITVLIAQRHRRCNKSGVRMARESKSIEELLLLSSIRSWRWLGFFLNLSMLQALGIRAHDASAKLAERHICGSTALDGPGTAASSGRRVRRTVCVRSLCLFELSLKCTTAARATSTQEGSLSSESSSVVATKTLSSPERTTKSVLFASPCTTTFVCGTKVMCVISSERSATAPASTLRKTSTRETNGRLVTIASSMRSEEGSSCSRWASSSGRVLRKM
mmetsp:Transcript_30498/g.74185  ORF Transcript_30498/g.74185 Transcript_30498/m.74185 type:complete len:300 (+) Transcript_30498:524-1423(+)